MLGVAGIDQLDPHPRIEERKLAVTMLELFEIELEDVLEGVGRRREGHARALLARGRGAVDLERGDRVAMFKAHPMLFAVAPDRQFEPFRQRVDHRNPDAVQTARHLVRIVVAGVLELPAGVELGHDDLGRRNAFFGVNAGRDAAAIVLDADRSVAVQRDQDQVAMPRKRFVDRIVRNLEHHVMQPRPVVGIADIHARALADRIQALENLDRIGAISIGVGQVGIGAGRHIFRGVRHADYIGSKAAKPKRKCGSWRLQDERCARAPRPLVSHP